MSAEQDREFAGFVGGRGTSLLRTAYLLAGDTEAADDAVVEALARTRLAWKQIGRDGDAESYAQRLLVTTRRANQAPAPAGTEPERLEEPDAGDSPPDDEDDPEAVDRERVWSTYLTLPPAQRSVLLLRVHEQLADEEIARLLGRPVRRTQAEISRALAGMRDALDPAGSRADRPLSDRLESAFHARVTEMRAGADLADRAMDRAERLRSVRRRSVLVAAGVCAVVGAVVLAVVLSRSPAPTRPGSAGPSGPSGVTSPGAGPRASVMAVPDAVLALAREQGVLLGSGSAVVDGSSLPVAVSVDVDPATGASRGDQITSVSRAEGGVLVMTAPQGSADGPWTLSYVSRISRRVELGRTSPSAADYAVSADGQSVVHAIVGPVAGENAVAAGRSELVVQTLAGDVLNRRTVVGPARPVAVDPDKVWFDRVSGGASGLWWWDRRTGRVARANNRPGTVTLDVRDGVALSLDPQSRCVERVDVRDPSAVHRLWRFCAGADLARADPATSHVAVLAGRDLSILDAGTGAVVGEAELDVDASTQLRWSADGSHVLAAGGTDVTVVQVRPTGEVQGPPLRYPLGSDSVALGQELPLPATGP